VDGAAALTRDEEAEVEGLAFKSSVSETKAASRR
jgi:hypothetical protein